MTATVVELRPLLCTECKHVLLGSALYCRLFGEPLWNERDAEQCMGFERDASA